MSAQHRTSPFCANSRLHSLLEQTVVVPGKSGGTTVKMFMAQ